MGLKKYVENEIETNEIVEEEASKEQEEVVEETVLDELVSVEEEPEAEEDDDSSFEKEITEKIDNERKNYQDYYKKQKKTNTLITIGVLVLIVGGFVMMLLSEKMGGAGIYIGIAILVLSLIATFVTSKFLKDRLSQRAQAYVTTLYDTTNDYIFNDQNITDLENKGSMQLSQEVFTDCHFYKNIKGTRNRNYVTLKYRGVEMISCDLAANILIKNRTSPMFLGKFYDYFSNYNNENGVILFQLKGGELSRPLDDVDGLKLVEANSKYTIYTNDENYKKVLNDRVLKELLRFKVDKTLIDVIVSIRHGKVSLGIDYSDEFMNIPVESAFDFKNTKRTKKDFERVLKVFDLINK